MQYLGLQGSTLTLLGLIKFDAESGEFTMSETYAFISGGFAEAKNLLVEAMSTYKGAAIGLGICAAIFLGISGGLWWDYKRRVYQREL